MREIINTFEYSVNPETTDIQGCITVPSMCGAIINAIGRNIRLEGCGIDVMKQEGLSWVLLRSAIEISDRPRLYDNYNIQVWPVKGSGLTYNRCVKVTNDEGSEIGCGTTEWCVIDTKTRRPVFPELDLRWCDKGLPCRTARRIADFPPDITSTKEVGYCDCDFNGHLNNTHYIEMFYNLLPSELLSSGLSVRIDINYRNEVRSGDKVSFGIKKENAEEYRFIAKVGERTLCHASLCTE